MLAKGRYVERDHIELIVEIFVKLLLRNPLFEGVSTRGDKSQVRVDRRRAAMALEPAFF